MDQKIINKYSKYVKNNFNLSLDELFTKYILDSENKEKRPSNGPKIW